MEAIIKLPDIGEGVTEGEVVEWLKQEGEPVAKDEPVVVVMTDKATVDLPSPHAGKMAKHYYKAGEVAFVDQPLYAIETEEKIEKKEQKHETPFKQIKKMDIPPAHGLATPATRALAKKLNVNLSETQGTGPGGRIEPKDLMPQKKSVPRLPGDKEEPLHGIRKQMAKKMAESKQTIPHFSYFTFADATRLIKLKRSTQEAGKKEGTKVTYMPLFIRALSKTMTAFPLLNSSIDLSSQTMIFHSTQNVGVAIATENGLIVPVLKDVEAMSFRELIQNYDALMRKEKYAPDEMRGATITISNFGTLDSGGRWATPIINPPEVAILAIAHIDKQPVVKGDSIVAQETLKLSWSFDHRVIDGDLAASISHYFVKLIENPSSLL